MSDKQYRALFLDLKGMILNYIDKEQPSRELTSACLFFRDTHFSEYEQCEIAKKLMHMYHNETMDIINGRYTSIGSLPSMVRFIQNEVI